MHQPLPQLYTVPSTVGYLKEFMRLYEIHQITLCPEKPNKIWKPKAERVCWFCKRKQPQTTF